MPPNPTFFIFFAIFSILFQCFPGLPQPDPVTIQPLLVNPSPSATIPAFPEQSNVVGCPLDLSDELFHGIRTACGANKGSAGSELRRSRCCPVLAAWLYSAYSATSLGRASIIGQAVPGHTTSYDMPLLPDDSETCVGDLDKALEHRGIQLIKPNETCDVVYCYCGIRLHPLSCPEAFSVTHNGKIVGDDSVKRLERNCLSSSNNVNGFPGLGGCSKCLNSLYLLNKKKISNSSKSEEDRTIKMHHRDCQLMGLTWLLAKNRTAYIHTVSGVLRAMMMTTEGSDPQSCTLNSDGMPLAVDSSEIEDSSSNNLQAPIFICLLLLISLLYMHLML
ncbi:GPI-anchored protein [Quillaja saponaria]|uniref:GPI-anchored protein n=1 Tax=Quillaja saponaria TaxID=32244 RepID=A0AAD7Q5D4_QUISA|nr:GPI-anchored protein [Quillaja saponaria]